MNAPARSVSLHLSQCAQLERDGKTPPGWTDAQAADYLTSAALVKARQLCELALPKFNYGASALDAQAIRLLNETPALIVRALAKRAGEL